MLPLVKCWLYISASIAFVLFVVAAGFPFINRVQNNIFPPDVPVAGSFQASKHNFWADLSRKEAEDLTKFLFSKSELNLTEAAKATSKDNSVFLLELLQPNKTDVLAYISGTSGPPERWARLIVDQGATEQAQYVIYAVGPLPLTESTKILPLNFCYNSGRNSVPNPMPDLQELVKWAAEIAMDASDITLELLGSELNPYDPDALDANGRVILSKDGSLMAWIELLGHSQNPDSSFLLSQGLYINVNATGRNPSNWKVLQWAYNNVLYESAEHLRRAMKSPNFQKNGLNLEGNWTTLEDFSEGLPDRKTPPPVMIRSPGSRLKVDEKQKFVTWMGFEFFITTSSDTGIALHNIKFGGDSVIYELGLQETFVTYASNDPKQGGQDFLDSGLLMGFTMVELVPGYDCPAYATFLSTAYHIKGQTIPRKNCICIFEYTADYALQRHTSASQVSIGKNTYMVVRFVSTVGNYDYTFDYVFYLDGTIEVKVRASGFIFGVFWNENDPRGEYGYRIHDAAATAMHDHVLNFKADLDVVGTSNTMVNIGMEEIMKEFPWDDEKSRPRNTMHLVPRAVEREMGINWAPNSGEILLVLNENATNAWGEKRGYRIQPGSGIGTPAHRTITNSTSSGVAAEWATKDLWVVKQKDIEPKSSTVFNAFSPSDPLVDFKRFADGEEIVDDDLVVFFNLGSHHVPHSGDIPNTLMHTSASSVMFTPFNFHDSDPTRRSAQGVRIVNGNEGTKVRYYGGRYREGVTLKKTDLEPDQSKYNGPHEESVREKEPKGIASFLALAFGLL